MKRTLCPKCRKQIHPDFAKKDIFVCPWCASLVSGVDVLFLSKHHLSRPRGHQLQDEARVERNRKKHLKRIQRQRTRRKHG
jgi:ssDNA-binding Zn-finger/Zn-ribbon topoisomerase 1